MKLKSIKLKWNVLYYNSNSKCVQAYNVLNDEIKERIYKKIKTGKIKNYEELKQDIDSWTHYHYWSKTECEMAIGGLHCNYPDDFEKIDMYRQIEMNLDRILEYIINTMQISFE